MFIKCNQTKPLIKPPINLNEQCEEKNKIRYSSLIEQDYIESYYPNVKTCLDVIYNGMKLSETGECFGYHKQINKNYLWITYEQVIIRMKNFGSGLINLGCLPSNHTKICIYSINRVEWSIAQYACYHYSMVVVPLYETFGKNSRIFMLNEINPDCIIVDSIDRIDNLLDDIKETPNIKLIICMQNYIPDEVLKKAKKNSVKIISFSKVELIGKNFPKLEVPPEPSFLAMIMYTSGTTGYPKGVMLTHRNFVASASGLAMQMSSNINLTTLTLLSLLPMSHSFEQCVQTTLLMSGSRIGFFSGEIKNLQLDLKLLKPTVLVLVPRLLNRIYNSVIAKVKNSKFKSLMLKKSLNSKERQIKNFVYDDNFMDKLVFKELREKFGGNLRFLATGSARLSPTILSFFRCSLNCIVIEGYGTTETCGASISCFPGDYTTNHVGVPLVCCKVKLIDVPEMNYFVDKNNTGEICIKGSNVFNGYYKNEESTFRVLDKEGWLQTGDIGKFNKDRTISIIDRKKHIFKLSQGEYIAPEKIENVYLQSSFVSQCFVDGLSSQDFIIAIIVPDIDRLNTWCNERLISLNMKEACENPSYKKAVMDDILSVADREGLNSLEKAKEIHLHPLPFSIENDLLTPTMKIKRNQCRQYFRNTILNMYNITK